MVSPRGRPLGVGGGRTTLGDSTDSERRLVKRISVLFAIVILGACNGIPIVPARVTATTSPSPYAAKVMIVGPDNPSSLQVLVDVTNTGTTAGRPTCTLTAADVSHTYVGHDRFRFVELVAPGTTGTITDSVTINREGARWITDVKADCRQ